MVIEKKIFTESKDIEQSLSTSDQSEQVYLNFEGVTPLIKQLIEMKFSNSVIPNKN